jgi:hypothetical protein
MPGPSVEYRGVKGDGEKMGMFPETHTFAMGGLTQQFTAIYQDTEQYKIDVTRRATWTTSNAAIATVASTGIVTSIGSGTVTITATDTGISVTATVIVS